MSWKTSWLALHPIQRIMLRAHLQGTALVLVLFFSLSLDTATKAQLFVMFMLMAQMGYPAIMGYFWIKKETTHEKRIDEKNL